MLVDIDDIRVMKFLSEEDDPSESDGERAYRNGWNDALTAINDIQPSAELDLIAKIQNGIKATNADDTYSCGMRNGMRWCISLIDGKEPVYENCPSAEPEYTLAMQESDIDEAVKLVRDARVTILPSAQPEPRWIPCSEIIDIPDHEVLCCDKYGEELIGWLSYNDDQWLCESDGEMMYDTIAWREKPEPYKGEQDGQ